MSRGKIACVFGTRPELIKMAPVVHAFQADEPSLDVEVICTGQHKELLAPLVAWFDLTVHKNMEVMRSGQSLNELTGRLMRAFGKLFSEVRYDCVIGQGDTTSVFAAAFAAFHEKIPFAHVEAGLRTFNKNLPFPEEMNRVLVSQLSSFHFSPTEAAVRNLRNEGIPEENLFMIGNTVIDALQYTARKIGLVSVPSAPKETRTILVTAHRRENFGKPLENICFAVKRIAESVTDVNIVFPVHPNPNVRGSVFGILGNTENIRLIDPVPYEQMVRHLQESYLVLTDSGGLQEEASALGKPVLVLREETERQELVDLGASILVGSNESRIVKTTLQLLEDREAWQKMVIGYSPYGDGRAGEKLVSILSAAIGRRSGKNV